MRRMKTQPVYPNGEPACIRNIVKGFVDGAGVSHAASPGVRSAVKIEGVWYWVTGDHI